MTSAPGSTTASMTDAIASVPPEAAGALIVRSVAMARSVNLSGLLIVALSFFGLLTAVTVLVLGEDEAGGTLPGGGTWYASDVVTRGEALSALAITLATAAAVAVLERLRR